MIWFHVASSLVALMALGVFWAMAARRANIECARANSWKDEAEANAREATCWKQKHTAAIEKLEAIDRLLKRKP